MIQVSESPPLKGELNLPGDKSISHRAVILGALSEGQTVIENFLCGEDTLATIKMLREMGVKITDTDQIQKTQSVTINGVGLNGLKKPGTILDAGNSGTAFRLMLGILAGQEFKSEITGDSSLQKRPMKRVTEPLSKMGGSFSAEMAPIQVTGKKLKSIKYELPVASAQVKSAVLLAGLYANKETIVIEPVVCRDHTERMLESFGANIKRSGQSISISPSVMYGQKIVVPADISSAAFFIVPALLIPGSEIKINGLGLNPTRTGILTALEQMGADLTISNQRVLNNEPVGDILVRHSQLNGINLGGNIIPLLIDEIPILAVAMSSAKGRSVISDAQELKVKESDRIASTISMLKSFGAHVTSKEDGFIIEGDSELIFGNTDSYGDHRIAMSGIILGLLAKGRTRINDVACISTSFPGFVSYLKSLGVSSINDQDS